MVFSTPAGVRNKRRRSAVSSAVAPVTVILAAAVLLSVLLISLKTGMWREVSSQTSTLLNDSPFPTLKAGRLHRRIVTVTAKQLIRDTQSASQMLSSERLGNQESGRNIKGGFKGTVVVEERRTRGGIRANAMVVSKSGSQVVLSGSISHSAADVAQVRSNRQEGSTNSKPQMTKELSGVMDGSAAREAAGAATSDRDYVAGETEHVAVSGGESGGEGRSTARESTGEEREAGGSNSVDVETASGYVRSEGEGGGGGEGEGDEEVGPSKPQYEGNPISLKDVPLRSLPIANDLDEEELLWRASLVPLRPRHPSHVRRGGKKWKQGRKSEGGEGRGEGSAGGARESESVGEGDRKVALLFVGAGDLPFAPLWAQWLRGHERLFSLYVDGDEQAGRRGGSQAELPAVFRGRFVSSKATRPKEEPLNEDSSSSSLPAPPHSHMGPVNTLRRLLATALLDPSNHRFLTICQRCVPLHNFTFLHSYLLPPLPAVPHSHSPSTTTTTTTSQPSHLSVEEPAVPSRDGVWQGEGAVGMQRRSFLPFNDAAGHGGRDRFNPSCFLPLMKVTNWRKGGPWLGLTRALATRLVADVRLYDAFTDCCLPDGMIEEEGEGEGEKDAEATGEGDGRVQQGGEGGVGQQESDEGGEGEDRAMNEGDGSSTLPRPTMQRRKVPVVHYPACFPAEHYFASALPMLVDPLFAAMAAGAAGESELMSVPGYAEDAGVGGGRSEGGNHLLPWGNMWGGVEEVTNWSLVFEDWWTNAGSGYPAIFLPNQTTPELFNLMRRCHLGNLCHMLGAHFHPSAMSKLFEIAPRLGLW